jgi:hypothetical protein
MPAVELAQEKVEGFVSKNVGFLRQATGGVVKLGFNETWAP